MDHLRVSFPASSPRAWSWSKWRDTCTKVTHTEDDKGNVAHSAGVALCAGSRWWRGAPAVAGRPHRGPWSCGDWAVCM